MESYLPLRSIFRRCRETWKPWLAVAAAAGLTVLLVSLLTLSNKNSVQAKVNFSYSGIERGLTPMGARFDANEMKSETVLAAAAGAAGLELEGDALKAVQDAITITGMVPEGTFSTITAYASVYAEKELSNTDAVRVRLYYPSQFTIELHYADAGLTAAQGRQFLNALLASYQDYFYGVYGYNSAFEQALRDFDYSSYDYVDAVDVLESNLTGLSSYLSWLSSQNNSRFVSTASGLSFDDLVDAIHTLRSENISTISSYINTNHLTKDRDALLTYYQYRVESLRRTLDSRQTYLETLNTRIALYTKDNALIMSGGASGELGGYEVSQPSETYNELIQSKVDVQTEITRIEVEMARIQKEIDEVSTQEQSEAKAEQYAVLQEQFTLLDGRIHDILDKTRDTATDYFRTEKLRQSFQVLKDASDSPLLVRVAMLSLRPGVGIEAVVFGVFVLSLMLHETGKRKKPDAPQTTEERTPAAAGA